MTVIIGWVLVALVLSSTAWSVLRARSGKRSRPAMIGDLVATLLLALFIGNLISVPWNTAIPIAVWWVIVLVVGVLAGVVAYRSVRVGDAV